MEVFRIVNTHQESNSYFFYLSSTEIVMVDVGDFDISCFNQWLISRNIKIRAVFLTHEHSDHCCGVNELLQYYDFDLFCSKSCAINIKDPKQNFSKYIDSIDSFKISKDSIVVGDRTKIKLNDFNFTIIETPGHSPGSICIVVNNYVFSGDTLMQTNTPLNLPHSDKINYKDSMSKLKEMIVKDQMIYPGHGQPFSYREIAKEF